MVAGFQATAAVHGARYVPEVLAESVTAAAPAVAARPVNGAVGRGLAERGAILVCGGLGGFTGAIPTLWCTLRGLEKDVQRSVIQNFNLSMQVVTFGSYLATGIVTDIREPGAGQRGWVRLKFPWLDDVYVTDWVRTVQWGGINGGGVFSPEVNDEVLVGFEQGSLDRPYVIGGLYNGVDRPSPHDVPLVDPTKGGVNRRSLVSRSGNRLELLDSPTTAGVRLQTGDKRVDITMDEKTGSVDIEVRTPQGAQVLGSISMTPRGITVDARNGDLVLKGHTVSVEARTSVSVRGVTEASVDGGVKAVLKGRIVEIGSFRGRSTVVLASAAAAGIKAFGMDRGMPFPLEDIPRTGCVILVGSNPAETIRDDELAASPDVRCAAYRSRMGHHDCATELIAGPRRERGAVDLASDDQRGRAAEVRDDAVVVVGGPHSNNTNQLVRLAESAGLSARRVNSPEELDIEWASSFQTIGLTAGTSTPDSVIDAVHQRLTTIQEGVPAR